MNSEWMMPYNAWSPICSPTIRSSKAIALNHGIAERVTDVRSATDKTARLEVIGCPEAALEYQPREADACFGPGSHDAVECDRLPAGHLHIDLEMILQIGADARKGMPDFDAL